MKLVIRILTPFIAAVMAGQSVVALADDVPQSPMSAAERAQGNSQDKKVQALGLLITQADQEAKTIQSFNQTIAAARQSGSKWVANADVDSYWMSRSLAWTSVGTTGFLITRELPELRGFEGARYVNVVVRYAKSFTKPAAVFIVVGLGVAIWATIKYEDAKAKIEFSNGQMEQVKAQIATATMNYNTKVDAIKEIASQLGSTITQHDRNITISGLNFPNLRNLSGGTGVLQLQQLNDDGS